MMTQHELLQSIQPILHAYDYEVAKVTDSELLSRSVEVRGKSHSFGGAFLEAIGSFCRANFVTWIVMIDGDNLPLISISYSE